MAIATGELDPSVYSKYKSFGDTLRDATNNALAQQTARMDLASKANIYKTQVLSAAAGSGDPNVVNAAFQHLNQNDIDTSDVPTDLPSLTKYTDAARLAQSPLGSLLGAGLKAEGNLNQAATITGNTGTAASVDPLSAAIAAKLGGFTGQPATTVANMPVQQSREPLTAATDMPQLQPQPNDRDSIPLPVKPAQVAAIDGTAPAVTILPTPTQGMPIYAASAQLPGETQAAYQARKANELEQFKLNNAAAIKQQESQAGTTGELNAKDIEAAKKADELTKRLDMNLQAMQDLNPDVPSSGFVPESAKVFLSQGLAANKLGSGASAIAAHQFDKINNDQILSDIQQFVATGGANTRINQTLEKIVQAASGIDKTASPEARAAMLKAARAEIANKNATQQNVVGGNIPYQPIPTTSLPMGNSASASQQQFNAQKGIIPYTAYFGGQ